MKKTLIYCRVSTEEQKIKGISIGAQERACRRTAEEKGYKLIEVIKDDGESAGSMNRPGLQRMLRLCEEKKIETIFMIHSDRLARNTEDHLKMRRFFKENDVAVVYVFQPSLGNNTAVGQTMDTVMAAFNEMQRLVTSEKTKNSLLEKAREGWFPGVAPLGYKNVENPNFRKGEISKRIIVINPETAPLVKEMFTLYATGGYSVYELVEIMAKKGLKSRRNKILAPSKVYETLKNPIYVGELHWGEAHIENAKHTPIINRETFQEVQSVMDGHNHHACRRRKYRFLLRGFVYCADCGRRLTAEQHVKKNGLKFAYYHCTKKDGCNRHHYIDTVELEKQVENKFKEIQFSDSFINLVFKKAEAVFKERATNIAKRKKALYNKRTAVEQQRDVAEEKLFKRIISDEDFARNKEKFEKELNDVQSVLSKLEEQREIKINEIRAILRLARNIYSSYKNAPSYILKRHYLAFFWDRFEVKKKKIVRAEPTKLFKVLQKHKQIIIRHRMGG